MTIFNVLSLIGGLALFLFGMHIMGDALEKAAGPRLKNILAGMTSSPLRGLLLGLGVTAVIQSSSATTVMVVGFVNSGLMQLWQAIGVIMGANIGTTVTAWLLSLTGIDGSSVFINLLKPSSFTPILALIGIVILMVPKFSRRRDVGMVLLGFAVLMYGMEGMSSAVAPLSEDENFARLFLLFQNPLFGVLAGALLTGIIQSSSASVGILQALAATGAVTFGSAIPIIMGQNIGTTVTAILSSIGTSTNARRAALVHFYFNIIGTIVCLTLFFGIHAIVGFSFLNEPVNAFYIAVIHTAFNVFCTALLLPFSRQLEALAVRTVRDRPQKHETQTPLLDERLLSTPSIAVERSRALLCDMADDVSQNLLLSLGMLIESDEKTYRDISDREDNIDRYEDALGSYLIKLGTCQLTDDDSRLVSFYLHCITDFERIGDHALNIADHAKAMASRGSAFSEQATEELRTLTDALIEITVMTVRAFRYDDLQLAQRIEPLEQVIDRLDLQIKDHHIRRLREGACQLESGFDLDEILIDVERISDHCSNIAAYLLARARGNMDVHAYLDEVKSGENTAFQAEYRDYLKKYCLPA